MPSSYTLELYPLNDETTQFQSWSIIYTESDFGQCTAEFLEDKNHGISETLITIQ